MAISTEIGRIIDRMRLSETVIGTLGSNYIDITTRYTPESYNLLKEVVITDGTITEVTNIVSIGFRSLRINKPSGWTATNFQILGTAPYFFDGHPKAIINDLAIIAKSRNVERRYPFIAMLRDFTEKDNNGIITVDMEFIIGTVTDGKYTTSERETINFTPILTPLVDQFKRQLTGGGMYLISFNYIFDETKNMFLGKQGIYGSEGNIFNDRIDAITLKAELKFLNYC